jgi:hypothetical protein
MNLEMLANQTALVGAFALIALCLMYLFGYTTNARYYRFIKDGVLIRERSESSEI